MTEPVLIHHPRNAGMAERGPEPEPASDPSIGRYLQHVRQLSDAQMAKIVEHQKATGLRFGEAAIALKLVTQDEVLWALSQQFDYPYAQAGQVVGTGELVTAADPFSALSEVFRDLRSQLVMGVLSPKAPKKALAVVSPQPGDGKTFFAANLAVVLSQLGARTLLIDADMRTPRLHEVFGVTEKAGLSSALMGRTPVTPIRPSPALPHLFLLPVGTVPPNPLELVQGLGFDGVLDEVLPRFDFVIVDTPAHQYGADARVIAAKGGAALALGRRGKTSMKDLKSLTDALAKLPVKMAGAVINEW